MSAEKWARRCLGHIEAASRQLAPLAPAFAHPTLQPYPSPYAPAVRFEVRLVEGYWAGGVSHGKHPCVDFDVERPYQPKWLEGTRRIDLDRYRFVADNRGWLEAEHVPDEMVMPFRCAFEAALDLCLDEASAVPLAEAPPEMCLDKTDTCPEEGCDAP